MAPLTKRRLFYIPLILALSLWIGCSGLSLENNNENKKILTAQKGYLEITDQDLHSRRVIALDGEWIWHGPQMLTRIPLMEKGHLPNYIKLPGKWNTNLGQDQGTASFSLRLRLPTKPATQKTIWGLYSSKQNTAFKIFINGRELASSGKLSPNYQPGLAAPLVMIPTDLAKKHNLELVVQVANYHHRSGGLVNSIYFGPYNELLQFINNDLLINNSLITFLFLVSLVNFLIFSFNRQHTIYLLFAGLSSVTFLRELSIEAQLITRLLPQIDYESNLLLEYISFFWQFSLGSHFFCMLIQYQNARLFGIFVHACAAVFSILSFFIDFPQVTYLINYYHWVVFVNLAFLVYASISNKRAMPRKTVYIIIFTFVVVIFLIVYDTLHIRMAIQTTLMGRYVIFIPLFIGGTFLMQEFANGLHRAEKLNVAFRRFVPQELLSLLNKESINEVNLGDSVNKKMTLMFSDIRNFSTMSEQLSSGEVFTFINSYLKRMSPLVRANHGFIDKFIGDAIMSLFPRNPEDAILASIAQNQMLLQYNSIRQKRGHAPIHIGTGIHTGTMMLGTVGERERMETTVISNDVNIAARIEELTKPLGATSLVSKNVYDKLDKKSDKYCFRCIGYFQLKGISQSILLYELLDCYTDDLHRALLLGVEQFNAGLRFYEDHKYTKAGKIFTELANKQADDKVAQYYAVECNRRSHKKR